MPRQRRGGVMDASRRRSGYRSGDSGSGDSGAGEIEILNPDSLGFSAGEEILGTESSGSLSPLAVVAGVVVAAVAMFGVVNAGNTPAPAPPTPLVTVPPVPLSPEEEALAAEVAELEATYGVEIGEGPDLNWQPVVWNIDVGQFQWTGDGFVGDNGETQWTIQPSMVGPTVSQNESLELEFPGYRMQPVDGARLLIPDEGPADHLLAIVDGRDPVRFELPPTAPATELANEPATSSRIWVDAQVIDEQLVIVGFQFSEIDDVDLSEPELTDLELLNTGAGQPEAFSMNLLSGAVDPILLQDLGWAASVSRTASGAALVWSDSQDAQSWLSTSTNGTTWSTKPISADDRSVRFSGSQIYTVPIGGPSSIRRSSDLGRTWERTRRPFTSSFNNLAVDDIIIVNNEQPASFSDQPVSINTGDYIVTITGAGRSFELIDPETGEIVVSGTLTDSATGLAFDPFGPGLAIADPTADGELLSIPQGALLQAYAEAGNLEPAEIAVTRWDPDADDPEWLIQPLDALFNDAVRVDFEVGGGHILAIVTTTRGYDYYVASTE